MRISAFPHIMDSTGRLVRTVAVAAALTLTGMALACGSAWIRAAGPPKVLRQQLAIWLLATVHESYLWVWLAAVLGGAISGWFVWRMRRPGAPRRYGAEFGRARLQPSRVSPEAHQEVRPPSPAKAPLGRAVRCFIFCASCICSLGLAEAGAAAWLTWLHRLPHLPVHFAEPARPAGAVSIVVVGGSSAMGVPYENWLSVGTVISRELQQVLPGHRFHVEVLAELGATLEDMHHKLARLERKPDILIVYSGHNEFLARFTLANQVFYYDDERSSAYRWVQLGQLSRVSPFLTLVSENLERQRLRVIPSLSLGLLDRSVGRPICLPAMAAKIVADFGRRLESIVSDCERIGCLPVLVIPPGNDAADPSRSFVSQSTNAPARRSLGLTMKTIRQLEDDDPARAVAEYRRMIVEYPTFAHAHYRLGRLLEAAGLFAEANDHYILARDNDGMPLRCLSRLETAYHSVAARHAKTTVLVDGPEVLRARSRHGILDDEFFHDLVHPALNGHVALAGAILAGLKTRRAFGWPEATPVPPLDPDRCAVQFGIDADAWASVYEHCAAQYEMLAFLTVDPAQRIEHRDRLRRMAKKIRAGVTVLGPIRRGNPKIGGQSPLLLLRTQGVAPLWEPARSGDLQMRTSMPPSGNQQIGVPSSFLQR